MSAIRIGDVGTVIRVTVVENGVPIDVSLATVKEFVFVKPSRSTVTRAAAFTTTGVDGKIQYTTAAGDLDDAGGWTLQARVVLPSGAWTTEPARFDVRS